MTPFEDMVYNAIVEGPCTYEVLLDRMMRLTGRTRRGVGGSTGNALIRLFNQDRIYRVDGGRASISGVWHVKS